MPKEFWTDELTRLARLAVELVMIGGREAGPEPVVAGLSPLAFWLACLFLPLGFSPLCLKDRDRETHLPFTKWDMREHWMVRSSSSPIFLYWADATTTHSFLIRWPPAPAR
jgi:hypothetical protein